ncbi:amidohydrolase family protein [Rhodococcus sp. MEB032]|uniref:amidohydrolase family protein n=1 Tax=Rhodococcus sp. MEB032 TaxID=3040322 RepID=UPI002550BEF4|nr:amidohydrolase family protein [Rhodococcus sp. MEB032]
MSGIIDCETHYFTEGYLELLRSRTEPPRQEVLGNLRKYYPEPSAPTVACPYPSAIEDHLLDLSDTRIALMDQHSISAQVVSLTAPGTDMFETELALKQARDANDVLGAAVARHPDRFLGFATLAPFGGDESANELERCVADLGFKGVNIHSHVGERYLDDSRCWPIFEAAQKLGVPINIHPTLPQGAMLEPYLGFGWALGGPSLGFGHEVCRRPS